MKNRFGSTNEIGIFEMHDTGLREVTNPSAVFLAERRAETSGSAVVASMEGTRPLLVEVQALVAPTSYGVPQRTATGFDSKRLQMILAVLEKRVGLRLGQFDVFVNVAGGVRVDEPAADLGMAVAIVSSLRDIPVRADAAVIGEVGLGGEIRSIHQIEKRLAEAQKLGFKRFVLPGNNVHCRARAGGNPAGAGGIRQRSACGVAGQRGTGMKRTLIKPRSILTLDPVNSVIEGGALLVSGTTLEAVLTAETLGSREVEPIR